MSQIQEEPIEVAEASAGSLPVADHRPRMPELLPVRLRVIEDVHVQTTAGHERQLDRFYETLLGFERDEREPGIVYRAENARIVFEVLEVPSSRAALRPVGIEVPSLAELEMKLIDRGIEYTRERGLTPGQDVLLLADPAGNWVELNEAPIVW